ncbi:MAG: CatA-like O-acetyltransferase [Lentisphaerae bacterium]|nr:CatA-like O-acetyltransferase [Lentisphaerota bacterium]
MSDYKIIELASWPRKELFEDYQKYAAACYNVSVKISAGRLYDYAKDNDESFFLLSLYAILRAANQVEQLRRRVVDNVPLEFDRIAALTPVLGPDELFYQVWCDYCDTFAEFKATASPKIAAAKLGKALPLGEFSEDFICASCLPWLHFESIAHAEMNFDQTIPILSWGKLENNLIPISIKVNHSLVDGLHISRFFNNIQRSFDHPSVLF